MLEIYSLRRRKGAIIGAGRETAPLGPHVIIPYLRQLLTFRFWSAFKTAAPPAVTHYRKA